MSEISSVTEPVSTPLISAVFDQSCEKFPWACPSSRALSSASAAVQGLPLRSCRLPSPTDLRACCRRTAQAQVSALEPEIPQMLCTIVFDCQVVSESFLKTFAPLHAATCGVFPALGAGHGRGTAAGG